MVSPEYAELSMWEALARFQAVAPVIRKTEVAKIEGGRANYSYTFAGFATVWGQISELMEAFGFVWTGSPTMEILDGGQSRFVLEYVLHHIPSGKSLTGKYPLKGDSPRDAGGAITYARRYALVAVLNLIVDEDDDDAAAAEARAQMSPSEQQKANRPPRAQRAKRETQRAAPEPVATGEPGALSRRVQSAMFAALGELGLTERDPIMEYVNETLAKHGAPAVGSSKELTDESAGWVIERAKAVDAGPEEG